MSTRRFHLVEQPNLVRSPRIPAQNVADLHALGPYVARTLPGRAAPKQAAVVEVPESALSGP
ncbi:MAG TPA: hypothetical protein PKA22_12970, partial [Rhodocyclaceae bacterium]|nr:hypothetical protein [Rhodocyclaceae bacterium]